MDCFDISCAFFVLEYLTLEGSIQNMWVYYAYGLLTIPGIVVGTYLLWALCRILYCSIRDVYRLYLNGLVDGYSKLHWLWIIPCGFLVQICDQTMAVIGGYETEVVVYTKKKENF